MVTGNYVNFAICEYYQDSIFTQLSQLIFTTVSICDYEELKSYASVHRVSFLVTMHFFNNHLDLLFTKFETSLIESILGLILKGMRCNIFEIQADCCTTINHFNEYVLERL